MLHNKLPNKESTSVYKDSFSIDVNEPPNKRQKTKSNETMPTLPGIDKLIKALGKYTLKKSTTKEKSKAGGYQTKCARCSSLSTCTTNRMKTMWYCVECVPPAGHDKALICTLCQKHHDTKIMVEAAIMTYRRCCTQ